MITARAYQLRFSTLAWLITAMAMATGAFIDLLPRWMPFALGALGAAMLWRSWRGLAPPRLGLLRMSTLAVGVVALLWSTHHLGLGIDAASPLFVAFLWLKLLELHTPRDVMRACFLSLFLVTAQLLIAQSLAQTLYAVVTSLAILGALVHLQVVGPNGPGATDARPLRTVARSLRTATIIVAQAMPFAAILFLLIPRPEIGPGLDQKNAVSGVTDVLDPNQIAEVAKSTQPAFRVEFGDGVKPAPDDCYWRGVVLWHTDGSSWDRKSNGPRWGTSVVLDDRLTAQVRAARVSYVLAMQPTHARWLFTLDCPTGMVSGDAVRNRTLDAGLVFQLPDKIDNPVVYRCESNPAAIPRDLPQVSYRPSNSSASDDPSETARSPYLLTPTKLDPRITELAARLRGEATISGRVDAERLIVAALAYFRTEHFVYTLQPGEMGPNGTAAFLFEKKRGFCGHYANAFSLLVRLAGIPSRVVIGYYGGEINPIGGYLLVRQSDAHAWSEVWIDGKGWQRVDATSAAVAVDDQGNVIPPESHADRSAFTASSLDHTWLGRRLKSLRDRWDFIEAKWDRWALGYDADTMHALLAKLGLQRWGALGIAALILISCGLLLAAVMLGMRRRRRARDPAITLYGVFCRRLARVGVPRATAEGPIDYARRAGALLPDHAERIASIASGYASLRYGGEPQLTRARLTMLAHEVRRFRPRRGDARTSPRAAPQKLVGGRS